MSGELEARVKQLEDQVAAVVRALMEQGVREPLTLEEQHRLKLAARAAKAKEE